MDPFVNGGNEINERSEETHMETDDVGVENDLDNSDETADEPHEETRLLSPVQKLIKSIGEEELDRSAPINLLPDVMLVKILKMIKYPELMDSTRMVCKLWFQLCQDASIWKRFRVIDFMAHSKGDAADFEVCARYGKYIQFLDGHVETIPFDSFCKGLQHMPLLALMRCPGIKSKTALTTLVDITAKYCPMLEAIDLELDPVLILDMECVQILRRLKKLKRVKFLTDSKCITVDLLKFIEESLPNLTALSLEVYEFSRALSDECLAFIADSSLPVNHLEVICEEPMTMAGVNCVKRMKFLRSLSISAGEDYTKRIFKTPGEFSSLLANITAGLTTVLHLVIIGSEADLEDLVDDGVRYALENLPNLRYVRLGGQHLTDRTLLHIEKLCPSLILLELESCNGFTTDGLGRLLKARQKTLTKVNVSFCEGLRQPESVAQFNELYPHIHIKVKPSFDD